MGNSEVDVPRTEKHDDQDVDGLVWADLHDEVGQPHHFDHINL